MTRTEELFEYGIDRKSKMLYIGSVPNPNDSDPGTDASMAERAIKGLWLLDETPGPITVIMNNHGGDELHGMAIFDSLRNCRNHVSIHGYGHLMSMGSIIFQGGNKRLLAPNSRVMIHYGTPMLADMDLHAKEQQVWSEECKKWRDGMEKLYLSRIQEKHPKFKLSKLRKMLAFATILNPTEAIALGLADEILQTKRP